MEAVLKCGRPISQQVKDVAKFFYKNQIKVRCLEVILNLNLHTQNEGKKNKKYYESIMRVHDNIYLMHNIYFFSVLELKLI